MQDARRVGLRCVRRRRRGPVLRIGAIGTEVGASREKLHSVHRLHATPPVLNGRDRSKLLEILNAVLALEIVSLERCKQFYYGASGSAERVRLAFLNHAVIQSLHADRVAERITELGGFPNFAPAGLAPAETAECLDGSTILRAAERHLSVVRADARAVRAQSDALLWLSPDDVATRSLLDEIVSEEEEHATQLGRILGDMLGRRAPAMV